MYPLSREESHTYGIPFDHYILHRGLKPTATITVEALPLLALSFILQSNLANNS